MGENVYRRIPGYIGLITKMVLSTVLLVLIFSLVPLTELWKSIGMLDVRWVGLAYLLVALQFMFLGLQFQIAMRAQGVEHSLRGTWTIQLIATFYGVIVPTELTASLVKVYRLSKGGRFLAQAAAAVIYCRLLNTMVCILMAIPALFFEPRMASGPLRVGTLCAGAILLLSFLPFISARFATLVEAPLHFAFRRLPLPKVVTIKGRKLWGAVRRMNDVPPLTTAGMVVLSILFNVMPALILCILAGGLDIPLNFMTALLLVTAVYVLMMLPISIAGLGVREITFVGVLTHLYGIDAAMALSLSFLFLGTRLAAAAMGGIIELHKLLKR